MAVSARSSLSARQSRTRDMEREHIGRPALSSSAGRHRWPEPSGYPVGQETAGRPATDRHFVQEGLRGIVDQRSPLTALRGEFNRSLQQLIQSRHGQPGLGSLRGAGWTRRCPSQRKSGACRRGNACGICCRWNHGQPSRTRRMDISTLCPPLCQPRRACRRHRRQSFSGPPRKGNSLRPIEPC